MRFTPTNTGPEQKRRNQRQAVHEQQHILSILEGDSLILCRHCHGKKANRPRGLCWTCYYRPGVRDRYPSTSKFGRREIDDFYGWPIDPPEPTAAPPGSPEKVAVLENRARQRVSLWHPKDAPM